MSASFCSGKSARSEIIVITPLTKPEDRNKNINLLELFIEAEAARALCKGDDVDTDGDVQREETASSPPLPPSPEKDESLHHAIQEMRLKDKEDLPDDDTFYVGMDLEGVNLGRSPGTLELISLSVCSTRQCVFVIDAAGFFFDGKEKHKGDASVERDAKRLFDILRNTLNHARCITVLHDCRRDCDALWNHLELVPRRVHDTSAVHWVLTGQENVNLNDTLINWDMPINSNRGRIDYVSQPMYWATRPLTREMVHYAAGDVHSLVPMAQMQLQAAVPLLRVDQVREQSEFYRDCLRNMERTFVKSKVDIGKFFGKGGSNIRLVEKRTGCFFYKSKSPGAERVDGFQVYHADGHGLRAARRALGWRD